MKLDLTVVSMKIVKKEHRDAVFIIVFAVCLYTISTLTCIPRGFSDDDWGIANYFAGVIDADYATPYNKFINFILGWMMYGLYQMLPGPNWFMIVQELIVALSFALLQFMLIQKMKVHLSAGWCYMLTSVLIASFEPSYLCRLEFTQTAALGSMIGLSWMMFSFEKENRKAFMFGIFLTILAALYRFASFEMCLPFVGLMLICFCIKRASVFRIKEMIAGIKKDRKLYRSIAGIILFLVIASKGNAAIYNSDYYAEYNAFNAARANVTDYPKAPYEEIEKELEKIGVSANDYYLMTSWTFADLSFFTTDLFRKVAAVQPKASKQIDYKKEVFAYFAKLWDFTMSYNKLFYMAGILLVLCLMIDFRHMIWYAPVLLAGSIIMELYFTIIVKRYPTYVRTGLLFCIVASALMITDFSRMRLLQGRWYMTVAVSCAVFFGLAPLGNEYYLAAKGTFEYDMEGLAMYEYMNSREEDIFMIPTGGNGGLPALRNSYSIFDETKPGIMRHTVGLGGWSTNNPWVNEAYHSWGIDYPMSQAADDNVYLCASVEKVDSIRTYLMEHKGMSTSASLSAVAHGTTIYKLTDNNIKIEKDKGKGVIYDVKYSYDNIYHTYDISVKFLGDDIGDGYRVFVSMEDEKGCKKYYMVSNGQNMSISADNDVTAKIPVSFIDNNTEYAVNIMVQKDMKNRLVCADEASFFIESKLHPGS